MLLREPGARGPMESKSCLSWAERRIFFPEGRWREEAPVGLELWPEEAVRPSAENSSCLSRSDRLIFFPEDRWYGGWSTGEEEELGVLGKR